jgi:hypothetical protein
VFAMYALCIYRFRGFINLKQGLGLMFKKVRGFTRAWG